MDFTTILGLIGTFVTFEEAGRGWIPIIKNSNFPHRFDVLNLEKSIL